MCNVWTVWRPSRHICTSVSKANVGKVLLPTRVGCQLADVQAL